MFAQDKSIIQDLSSAVVAAPSKGSNSPSTAVAALATGLRATVLDYKFEESVIV